MPSTTPETRTRVLAILHTLGQPRLAKRLDNLEAQGFELSAVAFARDYHSGRLPKCPTKVVGHAHQGRYLQRLSSIIRAIPKVRGAMRGMDAIYAFSPDMAMLAVLARGFRRTPIVLEVGDITPIQTAKGLRGALFRAIDRFITQRCQLIVSTTPRFIDEFYRKWLKVTTPGIVLENKVEKSYAEGLRSGSITRPPARTEEQKIRIGYFGALGCHWTMEVLTNLASRHGDRFEVLLGGFAWPWLGLDDYRRRAPAMEYYGEYKSPNDLPKLYGTVDLTWGCYQPIGEEDWNLRWARPNRFYESCAFGVPLVSRVGSCDAVDVERFGIGLIVSTEDAAETADFVARSVDRVKLAEWRGNMDRVPFSAFAYTDEFERLAAAIRSLAHRAGS
jgi:hypothetical protein